MEKTTLGLLAALGAAAVATPASAYAPAAITNGILHPTSVAELLEPIANPVETLAAVQSQPKVKPLQVADDLTIGIPGVSVHHHHHHHHHRAVIFRHHHHHHHHQDSDN